MISRNAVAAASLSLSCLSLSLFASLPAWAEGALDQNSDILGLKLHVPKEDIKKYIEDHFVTNGTHQVYANIGTNLYSTKEVIGYVAEITDKDEQEANRVKLDEAQRQYEARKAAGISDSPTVLSDGDISRDQVRISFVPGHDATGIVAIGRHREYLRDGRPVQQVVLDSIRAKYGPPAVTDLNGVMYWLTEKAVVKNRRLFGQCTFKMNDYSARIGSADNFDHYDENGDQASPNFLNLVNHVNNDPLHTEDVAACGTILAITVTPTPDRQYVSELQETLVDLSGAYAEMKAFAKGFWDKANAANQDQLSKDAQKKPAL